MGVENKAEAVDKGADSRIAAVRPLLRFAAKYPGKFYQPIYIGPTSAMKKIEGEAHVVGEEFGMPVCFTEEEWGKVVGEEESPAFLLLSVAEAEALYEQGEQKLVSKQVVIVGEATVDALPEVLQNELENGGLVFDPAEYGRPEEQEWSMGPTLKRAALNSGEGINPVLLLGPASALPFIADEAEFRLEAGGVWPVEGYSRLPGRDDEALKQMKEHGGVVIRLPGGLKEKGAEPELLEILAHLIKRNVQVVLVAEEQVQRTLLKNQEWKDLVQNGTSLVISMESNEGREAQRRAVEKLPPGVWPGVDEMLVGRPATGAEPNRVLAGDTKNLAFGTVLQTLSLEQHSGWALVVSPERYGGVRLKNGLVVDAFVEPGVWTLETLAQVRGVDLDDQKAARRLASDLVLERAAEIGMWKPAQFVVAEIGDVGRGEGAKVRLQAPSVALEIARREDEMGRRSEALRSLETVWQVVGEPGEGIGENERTIIEELDGEKAAWEVAEAAGLFIEDVRTGLGSLERDGVVSPGGKKASGLFPLPASTVARELLGLGLVPEARSLLLAAKKAERLDPAGYVLLAHLLVHSDPHGATLNFREGVTALGKLVGEGGEGVKKQLLLDALLNTLLLEVRGKQARAEAAWKVLQQYLKAGLRSHLESARHYAIAGEIALRAHDLSGARGALSRMMSKHATEPGGAELLAKLRVPFEHYQTHLRK